MQAWQVSFTHASLFWQSAPVQQSPVRHWPPPHCEPAPHSESVVHDAQVWAMHAWPGQSVLVQQLPFWQPPPPWPAQQIEPELQEVSGLVGSQVVLELPMQGWPPQSGEVQQVPVTQVPPQHLEPPPHWLSAVHDWQLKLLHRLLRQSALLQQVPDSQTPPVPPSLEPAPPAQHLSPVPHWVSVVHDWQLPLKHTAPPWQSLLPQQSPGEHEPLQHTLPEPHWLFAVHGEHWPETHTSPVVQSAAEQQLPARHTSEVLLWPPSASLAGQHLLPLPQSVSDEHELHEFPTQVWPPVQSAVVQQEP